MENTTENKKTTVSGSHIMTYSEEDLQQKRTSISAIIERLNAEQIRGDVVDEFEEERQRTIGEQKAELQARNDDEEAAYRQKLEEERKAREEEEARIAAEEQKKKADSKKEGTSSLSSTVADLSKTIKQELYKNGLVQKFFHPDDILEVEDDEEEEENSSEEAIDDATESSFKKKAYKKKGFKFGKKPQPEEDEDDFLGDLDEEDEPEVEEVKESKLKKALKSSIKPKKKEKEEKPKQVKEKKQKPKKTKDVSGGRKITIEYMDEPKIDEVYTEAKEVTEVEKTPMQVHQEQAHRGNERQYMLQEDISRFHEPVSMDEVYRFRSALERFSSDSYKSVSVYAACIIDREFRSISIIKNVNLLASLIEQSGDDLDFYFAYIITNKGVQHYGSDEALSDVSLAMEALRQLFITKKGRATIDQIQKLPSLKIFQTIYYEDRK